MNTMEGLSMNMDLYCYDQIRKGIAKTGLLDCSGALPGEFFFKEEW